MAIHIHTFNYLNDAHVLEQNVDFDNEYVLAQDPSLEMRIVYLVAWFFSQALAYLGIQIAMGNNDLLASLLDRHLDHLTENAEARNQNRVALCDNLQAVRNQEFVTDNLREKISHVQGLATTTQITFIEHLEATNLVKCTQLHQLRNKAFVTEGQQAQIDERIDAFFRAHLDSIEEAQGAPLAKCEQLQALKGQPFASAEKIDLIDAAIDPLFEAHVASIRDSAETFAVKRQQAIALGQAEFMNADRAEALAQSLPAVVAAEVTRIEQSDDEPLVKHQNLHALTEQLRVPGPFHGIDAALIQAAKLRALEAIPRKAMVEQNFMEGFFGLYIGEIDTYSGNLELYTFFMNRFVEQFVELLNYNYQRKHNQIVPAFNILNGTRFYLGYIEAMKNSGQFNSAKETSDSFKDLVTRLLENAIGEERSLAQRTLQGYVPFQNLPPLVIFNVHNQEDMAGLQAAVQDILDRDLQEDEVLSHEEMLVQLYDTHANRIGAAEKTQLADWISEALIYRFVSQQTAAGAGLIELAEIPPELTKAHHFINAYKMIKELNPNGDFALFAAGLDGLSVYLQTHLQWITGDFDEWFARPLGLIEADEDPLDLIDQEHKDTWFGQEVFRSFNYDLIKAFNGEQGELQDWVNTNLDTIIGNPMFLFRQELLQKWAGEELLARADESIVELLDNDTLVRIYGRDVAPFVEDVTSIFKEGILEARKEEFDFRKKAHLSIFQTALRGWAGFQFPELDLSQGAIIDQQRIVVENLVQRLPAFFDLDRLMAPIQMDIERSAGVVEELRAQQAAEAERLSMLAIAAGRI